MGNYGYCRVSTAEQKTDRQLDAMEKFNIPKENIYIDKQSGKDFNREQYMSLLDVLRPGDLLYVKSIDRLGRSYEDTVLNWRILTKERKIDIFVIDTPLLDTRTNKDLIGTFISDTMLGMLSLFAQSERDNIKQRQREGIESAQKRGVHMGRPVVHPPENFIELAKKWERGHLKTKELMELTGLAEATLYRRLKEQNFAKNSQKTKRPSKGLPSDGKT